jgi:NAD(P)H-dependent flavin oxidoreductase YrpB (nitropropane dioxygenase family)
MDLAELIASKPASTVKIGKEAFYRQLERPLSEAYDYAARVMTENMLAATSRDAIRSRVMTGKPARQLRTGWTAAWERPDAPDPLPMPLQGILYAEAATRFSRAHVKEFAGTPVGQIVGSIDRVRPARDVVTSMVEQWIETVERLDALMANS